MNDMVMAKIKVSCEIKSQPRGSMAVGGWVYLV